MWVKREHSHPPGAETKQQIGAVASRHPARRALRGSTGPTWITCRPHPMQINFTGDLLNTFLKTLLCLSSAALIQPAQAELLPSYLDADSQPDAYLDTHTMVLWYVNAGASGERTFASSSDWASSLVVAGNSDWRLPSVIELQSLYQTLIADYGSVTSGPFQNVPMLRYWSTTPSSIQSGANATLDMRNGLLYPHSPVSSVEMYAWAVQSVPEPASPLMLLAGAAVVGLTARKMRSKG